MLSRSISLYATKILERLIHNQIYDYLETRKLLDPYQSGYRKGHSTQSAPIKLSDDIRVGMERKHVTMLLLFGFSKAFDTVCHVDTCLHFCENCIMQVFLVQL